MPLATYLGTNTWKGCVSQSLRRRVTSLLVNCFAVSLWDEPENELSILGTWGAGEGGSLHVGWT